MKGMDFDRLTLEGMREVGEAVLRRVSIMGRDNWIKQDVRKRLVPALGRMRQEEYEVQRALNRLIDRVAELESRLGENYRETGLAMEELIDRLAVMEKSMSRVDRIVDGISGKDASNDG